MISNENPPMQYCPRDAPSTLPMRFSGANCGRTIAHAARGEAEYGRCIAAAHTFCVGKNSPKKLAAKIYLMDGASSRACMMEGHVSKAGLHRLVRGST